MIEQIRRCQKCGLCFNQKPLLDTEKKCQVFWVGLSAKKMESDEEVPLSPETNTGMLIQKIEELCGEVITYKTNLVKCLPLTEEQKLRYPNRKEIDSCFEHLVGEIQAMSPKIVFLLGEKVYSSVGKSILKNGMNLNIIIKNMKGLIMYQFTIHLIFTFIKENEWMNILRGLKG